MIKLAASFAQSLLGHRYSLPFEKTVQCALRGSFMDREQKLQEIMKWKLALSGEILGLKSAFGQCGSGSHD